MNIRALLIEDDKTLASGIIHYLELDSIATDYAQNGKQAIGLLDQNEYDVVITDVNMPFLSGFQLTQNLRNTGKDTPVIMVTSRDGLSDKEQGFLSGADDYLVKPFELKELLMRVRALSQRKSAKTKSIEIDSVSLTLDLHQRVVIREGIRLSLTKTGWKLLETLAKAWPEPVKKSELEFALWGDEVPESNSLSVQIHHLRQRVNKSFSADLIKTVNGTGFALNTNA